MTIGVWYFIYDTREKTTSHPGVWVVPEYTAQGLVLGTWQGKWFGVASDGTSCSQNPWSLSYWFILYACWVLHTFSTL